MPVVEPPPIARSSTEAVLSFLQQFLAGPADEPLTDILAGLADAFAADGAGLAILAFEPSAESRTHLLEAVWPRLSPLDLPWETSAEVCTQLRTSQRCLTCSDGDGNRWMMTTILPAAHPWVLWLVAAGESECAWTSAELASLELAGKCLRQRFDTRAADLAGPTRIQVQTGIDQAAAVTRRLTHDFCNILASVQGFAELALLNLKPDAPAHRYVKEALAASRQGAAWSHQMQAFGQNARQRFFPISLVQLLRAEALQPHWHGDVKLTLEFEPHLPSVAMEGDSLRRVLVALLDNAREAIAGPGQVTVSVRTTNIEACTCLELLGNARPGPHVEITITDTGSGLSEVAQDRLFREMFFTTKGRRRGSGPALAHGILQSYHAGFRLSPGRQGTIVQVYVPVAIPAAHA